MLRTIANFAFFRSRGVTLSNYMAVTHPSQPNYMASIGGDYFGMNDDEFHRAPANVSTVLDTRNISWAHYEEDMPYSGFEGLSWIQHTTGRNDYVRKHNPAVQFDSVTSDPLRLARLKNLSLFHRDLRAGTLPQWLFITPNMISDGHDSSVTRAGQWCRTFLEPLLNDDRFMKSTLVLITWDENETYATGNRILGILLGDTLDPASVGDDGGTLYTHYSQIATVSTNWDLPTLGRWDVGANVFNVVAQNTGNQPRNPDPDLVAARFWNESYAGPLHKHPGGTLWPAPNLALDASSTRARRPILPAVVATWAGSNAPTYYRDNVTVPDGMHRPNSYEPRNS